MIDREKELFGGSPVPIWQGEMEEKFAEWTQKNGGDWIRREEDRKDVRRITLSTTPSRGQFLVVRKGWDGAIASWEINGRVGSSVYGGIETDRLYVDFDASNRSFEKTDRARFWKKRNDNYTQCTSISLRTEESGNEMTIYSSPRYYCASIYLNCLFAGYRQSANLFYNRKGDLETFKCSINNLNGAPYVSYEGIYLESRHMLPPRNPCGSTSLSLEDFIEGGKKVMKVSYEGVPHETSTGVKDGKRYIVYETREADHVVNIQAPLTVDPNRWNMVFEEYFAECGDDPYNADLQADRIWRGHDWKKAFGITFDHIRPIARTSSQRIAG